MNQRKRVGKNILQATIPSGFCSSPAYGFPMMCVFCKCLKQQRNNAVFRKVLEVNKVLFNWVMWF